LGNPAKVVEYYQQVLAIARELKDYQPEALALAYVGDAYASLNNNQKAIEFAEQVLVKARETNNSLAEALALDTLSRSYSSLGDARKTFEFAQQALAVARQIKNNFFEVRALARLGDAHASLNQNQKAIEFAQQALALARETQNSWAEAIALDTLSRTYGSLGDARKTFEFAQQALVVARQIKNNFNRKLESTALSALGGAYWALKDYQKGIEYRQQALAIYRELRDRDSELSALHGINLGNNEKALDFSQASLAIARDPKLGRRLVDAEQLSLDTLGSIYRKVGRKEQAIAAYRESLAIDNGGFTAQVGLARAYRDLNMPITAIAYYKQAISSVEQIRGKILGLPQQLQESFLQALLIDTDKARNTDTYRELADLLLSQKRILEAQQVLELLKVQELRDFTRNTRAGGKTTETVFTPTEERILKENGTLVNFGQRLYECQQAQCNQLSQLLDQRQSLTEQFNQKIQTIEKEVRDRRAKDDAFFDPNKFAKAKEIVEAQPGTVLIYPFVLEDKIWLLWASKGGIIKSEEVPNVGQKQLGETVLKFRQLLQNPTSNIAQVKAAGKQLYDWLIKPIEPELKANKIQNLVFSLDRSTRYVPMSALFDGEKYLVENYAVSTVLSADLTDTRDGLPPGTWHLCGL
jgi:tetratricopeptide (TPR) repeat protein